MAQYYPAHHAAGDPEIGRRITREEWGAAVRALEASGIEDGWVQELPDALSPIAGSEIEPDPTDLGEARHPDGPGAARR